MALDNAASSCSAGTSVEFTKYFNSSVTVNVNGCLAIWLVVSDFGNKILMMLALDIVAMIRKNRSRKNMMSFIADIASSSWNALRLRISIILSYWFLKSLDKF